MNGCLNKCLRTFDRTDTLLDYKVAGVTGPQILVTISVCCSSANFPARNLLQKTEHIYKLLLISWMEIQEVTESFRVLTRKLRTGCCSPGNLSCSFPLKLPTELRMELELDLKARPPHLIPAVSGLTALVSLQLLQRESYSSICLSVWKNPV